MPVVNCRETDRSGVSCVCAHGCPFGCGIIIVTYFAAALLLYFLQVCVAFWFDQVGDQSQTGENCRRGCSSEQKEI